MPASFDGPNLIITLPSGTPTIDAKIDLYSDWKEWMKTPGNEVHSIAFDTTGGDPISATVDVAPYFFLRNDNGWRIRPAEEDAAVAIIGNLYGRDADLDVFIPPVGDFAVLLTIERSASALVVNVGGAALTLPQFLALK